jgi:hypothetical protein
MIKSKKILSERNPIHILISVNINSSYVRLSDKSDKQIPHSRQVRLHLLNLFPTYSDGDERFQSYFVY